MSRSVAVTCDGCGTAKPGDEDRPLERAWWDWQYTTMDVPAPGGHGWRFLSASWDLCPDCAAKVRAAVVAIVGEPDHESPDMDAAS